MMDFAAGVAYVLSRVPEGKAVTYGQLAALCGKPLCARLAGRVVSQGVSPRAWKVVGAGGRLTGAAAILTPGLQAELLRNDGVSLLPRDRVDLGKSGWVPTDEELAALKTAFAQREI